MLLKEFSPFGGGIDCGGSSAMVGIVKNWRWSNLLTVAHIYSILSVVVSTFYLLGVSHV
jgi:hypothetical protein